MLDRTDITFADALEREIRTRLQGDQASQGLYRELMGSPNWEAFVRKQGTILALEEVLRVMREIARRINDGEEPMRAAPSPLYGGKVN
jgi:hypothetical protein